jgi:hypothetical protein
MDIICADSSLGSWSTTLMPKRPLVDRLKIVGDMQVNKKQQLKSGLQLD